ncbi:MAG: hypothetical protein OXG82_07555 [Gammaproteobacteria bacterium]|nr:hypothetical protein [Gammaproteobacteria bacterium]
MRAMGKHGFAQGAGTGPEVEDVFCGRLGHAPRRLGEHGFVVGDELTDACVVGFDLDAQMPNHGVAHCL